MTHYVAQRGHDKRLNVLRLAFVRLNHGVSDKFLALLELMEDIVRAGSHCHIVTELFLRSQDNVTHLAKVLNYDVRVVISHEKELS